MPSRGGEAEDVDCSKQGWEAGWVENPDVVFQCDKQVKILSFGSIGGICGLLIVMDPCRHSPVTTHESRSLHYFNKQQMRAQWSETVTLVRLEVYLLTE
jgi:hypothetical protein